MKHKVIGVLAACNFVLTLVWLTQMIGITIQYGSFELFDDALAFAREQHWFYYTATYANALLLTLVNAMLLGYLSSLFKEKNHEWAGVGLVFISLYAILAIVSYLAQLVLVPLLINQLEDQQIRLFSFTLLRQWLQIWPHSTIQAFDQFSYFLLGFPCVIYGLLMTQIVRMRTVGWLYTVSGLFCMPIGVGIICGIPGLVAIPSMIGGVFSIFATGWLAVNQLKESPGQ
jgi:hypothetical protein